MPHFIFGLCLVTAVSAVAVTDTSSLQSCETERDSKESACRSNANQSLSQLTACHVQINRDYANCSRRFSSLK